MSTHAKFLSAAAILAFAAGGAPAAAQTLYYESGGYLYPAGPAPAVNQDAVYNGPIVLPPQPATDTAVRVIPPRAGSGVETSYPAQRYPVIVYPNTAARVIAPSTQYTPTYSHSSYTPGYAQQSYAGAYPAQSGYLPNGAQLVEFDRGAWLAECRARLEVYDENDRARVIGTLAGAVAGGIIGNRVADGNRLGGTLLGAGLGGLAGSAIGDSIDDRADRRASRSADAYCANYLDDYLARANAGEISSAYTAGQQYMLVPVTVPVAQETVYREYVTPAE